MKQLTVASLGVLSLILSICLSNFKSTLTPALALTGTETRVAQVPPAPQRHLPQVVVLATGGTIAGTGQTSTTTVGYTAATVGVEALLKAVPEINQIAQVRGEQILQIASENMTNTHWLLLAKRVNTLLAANDVDGIVITHGTDTIEETAYFLNLVVKSSKPVVLVGAMRPSTALSADGPLNLYNGVALAGSREAIGKGVLVCFNDVIQGAREVTKASTMLTDAFLTPDLGALGYVLAGSPRFYRQSTRKHTEASEFDVSQLQELPRVEIVYGYANSSRVMLDAAVAAGAAGIVYAGTGNGSLSNEVKQGLIDAQKQGVVIVRSSRTGSGIIARNGEAKDDELNFVASDNLNPQKARVLLTLALTKTKQPKAIQELFYTY
jgi:L-asparaginase